MAKQPTETLKQHVGKIGFFISALLLVALCTFATQTWPAKENDSRKWPEDHFQEVPRRFVYQVISVISIVGGLCFQTYTCPEKKGKLFGCECFFLRLPDKALCNIQQSFRQSLDVSWKHSLLFWMLAWCEWILLAVVALSTGFAKMQAPAVAWFPASFSLSEVRGCSSWQVLIAFFFPALGEELFFRILPLAFPKTELKSDTKILEFPKTEVENDTGDKESLLNNGSVQPCWKPFYVGYVVWMLVVYVFFYHSDALHAQHCLYDSWNFAFLAFCLGFFATLIYSKTGSWLYASISHWVPVWIWMNVLSGLRNVNIASYDMTCGAPYTSHQCTNTFDMTLDDFNRFLTNTSSSFIKGIC